MLTDEQQRECDERVRAAQQFSFRWRWLYSILWIFCIYHSLAATWEHRAQWPSLLSDHSLARFLSPTHLELNLLCVFVFSAKLVSEWITVGKYRREQARLEQERHCGEMATSEVSVWPPPPSRPTIS